MNEKLKKFEPILHVFFWCMILSVLHLKYSDKDYSSFSTAFYHEINILVFNMIPSYVMYLWFFPLKNKKKYIFVIISFFILNLVTFNYIDHFIYSKAYAVYSHSWNYYITVIVSYLFFTLVFFALYSIKKIYRKEKELNAIVREKQQAELRSLKAQVNPHFLFNTLNTIYANALKKDEKTPELILKLSNSFRYLLHEGQKEKVSLKEEIAHLKDYIELQEERLSNKIDVQWSAEIDDDAQEISPLLLISFVENAFKYTSLLKADKHQIKIHCQLKNSLFIFRCENPFSEHYKSEIDSHWKESGVGINNTKKRLQYLYKDRYQLQIDKKDSLFKVVLQIKL